jgi:hypothetical protein
MKMIAHDHKRMKPPANPLRRVTDSGQDYQGDRVRQGRGDPDLSQLLRDLKSTAWGR